MHNLFTLYNCENKLPFYAKRSSWSKAYVRVDRLDFKKQLAFGEYFYTKKSSDGLISGARNFDWCVLDKF